MATQTVANGRTPQAIAIDNANLGMEGFEQLETIFQAVLDALGDCSEPDARQILRLAKLGRSITQDYHNLLDCEAETMANAMKAN